MAVIKKKKLLRTQHAAAAAAAATAKSLQSCPTLCDPIDSSTPGSSVPGILQARVLEWVAIAFSSSYTISLVLKYKHSFWCQCSKLSDWPLTQSQQLEIQESGSGNTKLLKACILFITLQGEVCVINDITINITQ